MEKCNVSNKKCTGGSVPWVCEWHVLSHFIMVIPTHIAEKGSAPSFREREETRRFYTETLLHTESFTHKSFYTQTVLHTDASTRRRFYAQMRFTHAHALSHTNAFTHRRVHTQTLLHTDAFTHRRFYTQTLLHADAFYTRRHAFTHKRFYTQTPLHTDTFTQTKASNAIFPQFLTSKVHFVQKGYD